MYIDGKTSKMAEDFDEKCVPKLCDVLAAFGLGPKGFCAADACAAGTCSLKVLGNMLIGVKGVIVPKYGDVVQFLEITQFISEGR